jgi:hypothetical protein
MCILELCRETSQLKALKQDEQTKKYPITEQARGLSSTAGRATD